MKANLNIQSGFFFNREKSLIPIGKKSGLNTLNRIKPYEVMI